MKIKDRNCVFDWVVLPSFYRSVVFYPLYHLNYKNTCNCIDERNRNVTMVGKRVGSYMFSRSSTPLGRRRTHHLLANVRFQNFSSQFFFFLYFSLSRDQQEAVLSKENKVFVNFLPCNVLFHTCWYTLTLLPSRLDYPIGLRTSPAGENCPIRSLFLFFQLTQMSSSPRLCRRANSVGRCANNSINNPSVLAVGCAIMHDPVFFFSGHLSGDWGQPTGWLCLTL